MQSKSEFTSNLQSFFVERLEAKRMLAGDVYVTVNGDDVTIHGDGEANHIHVVSTADNSLMVVGMDGTNVIGGATHIAAKDVTIKLGGGDDIVSIRYSRIGDRLRVDGDAGNDCVEILESTVVGKTYITMNSGSDTAVLDGSTFERRLDLYMGTGTDTVLMGETSTVQFNNNSLVYLGAGDDLFHTHEAGINVSVGEQLIVNGAGGRDVAYFDQQTQPNGIPRVLFYSFYDMDFDTTPLGDMGSVSF